MPSPPSDAAPPPPPTVTVAVAALNVRAQPGLAFSIIATLHRGDTVALPAARRVADGYLRVGVVLADGRSGWTLGEPIGVR